MLAPTATCAGSDMDPEIHDPLHGRPGTLRHTTAKEEKLHAGNVEKPRASQDGASSKHADTHVQHPPAH